MNEAFYDELFSVFSSAPYEYVQRNAVKKNWWYTKKGKITAQVDEDVPEEPISEQRGRRATAPKTSSNEYYQYIVQCAMDGKVADTPEKFAQKVCFFSATIFSHHNRWWSY